MAQRQGILDSPAKKRLFQESLVTQAKPPEGRPRQGFESPMCQQTLKEFLIDPLTSPDHALFIQPPSESPSELDGAGTN